MGGKSRESVSIRRHPRTGGRCRRARVPDRVTQEYNSSGPENANFRPAKRSSQQESESQQSDSRCRVTGRLTDPRLSIQKLASGIPTRRRQIKGGGRTKTQCVPHPRARPLNSKGNRTDPDSSSGGESGCDPPRRGRSSGSACKSDEDAFRKVKDENVVLGNSSSFLHAKRAETTAAATGGCPGINNARPALLNKTDCSSLSSASVAFSKAVNPFSGKRDSFRWATLFPIRLFEKNLTYRTSSSICSAFASIVFLVRKKAPFLSPAPVPPLTVLLLFVCIMLSLSVVLLSTPLRHMSLNLLAQFYHDRSLAGMHSLRYCPQRRSLAMKSLVPDMDELPLLPLRREGARGLAGLQTEKKDCHACPEHAVCYGGHMKCLPPYVRVPADAITKNFFLATLVRATRKFLYGDAGRGDACVENLIARNAAEKVVERIVLLLRKRAGDAYCGSRELCDKLFSSGRFCLKSTGVKADELSVSELDGAGKKMSSAPDVMTRWELVQSKELHEDLKDDNVYFYVFNRLLEKKAALRWDVEVKQQYSFEFMKLPRDSPGVFSAFEGLSYDTVVAAFLRERRRSEGVTYSYTYIGPHPLRSASCMFRVIFLNSLVSLSLVITALSAVAFPLAIWLRRIHLRRQLLVLLQQQKTDQQVMVKSCGSTASGTVPMMYCGNSSAFLSQLLVQQIRSYRCSLLRWWLQHAAANADEVDAMCFELLHDKDASVRTARHRDQNFWWIGEELSPPPQHQSKAKTTSTITSCPETPAAWHQQPSTSTPRSTLQTTCELLQAPPAASSSLLLPQLSVSSHRSLACDPSSCSGPLGCVDDNKYERGGARSSMHDESSAQQADAFMSAVRCGASIPICNLAASAISTSPGRATAYPLYTEAVSPPLEGSVRTRRPPRAAVTAERSRDYAHTSYLGDLEPAIARAAAFGWAAAAGDGCTQRDSYGHHADMVFPADLDRRRKISTRSSAECSFLAFPKRTSDMQRNTHTHHYPHTCLDCGGSESPYCVSSNVKLDRRSVS